MEQTRSVSLHRVMFSRFHTSSLAALALPALALASAQQATDTTHYAGTVGQQRVTFTLETSGDVVSGGVYTYAGQKSEIHIVDSRRFGTTVVLQDEDGGVLHLHFEDADGEKAGSFKTAAMLEGTLDRGELDLPVKLKRVAGTAAVKP